MEFYKNFRFLRYKYNYKIGILILCRKKNSVLTFIAVQYPQINIFIGDFFYSQMPRTCNKAKNVLQEVLLSWLYFQLFLSLSCSRMRNRHVFLFLAHLSRRLIGELIVLAGIRRPSDRQHFQTTSPLKPWSRLFPYFTYSIYRWGERILCFLFQSGKNSGCYGNL